MKISEALEKAESFALEFISHIQNPNLQEAAKTVYFMDNQEELSKVLNALQRIAEGLTFKVDSLTDEEKQLIIRAESLTKQLKGCISEYQKSLTINNDITEEDTAVQLTDETIANAMQTNQTTQQISKDLTAIAEQNKLAAVSPSFNYVLACDGQFTMIEAHDKNTLNQVINQTVGAGNYKDIKLYQVSFKPVPLHQKTILSV